MSYAEPSLRIICLVENSQDLIMSIASCVGGATVHPFPAQSDVYPSRMYVDGKLEIWHEELLDKDKALGMSAVPCTPANRAEANELVSGVFESANTSRQPLLSNR